VWLNQVKWNLDMLLWSTKGKISTILTDFTFDVPELCPFMKYEIVKFRLEYSIRKKYHLFQYTIEKIKKECVHSTRMPPLPTNSWIYFLLHYGITINFTISYFIKGHNSGTSKVKSVKIVLIFNVPELCPFIKYEIVKFMVSVQ
jgi:hypothetical protein